MQYPTVYGNMTNTLPVELIYDIIDYLHGNSEALSACSLVSRSWLATARRHRWSKICLWQARIVSFMSLLVDIPDLSSIVTHLVLYNQRKLPRDFNLKAPITSIDSDEDLDPAELERVLNVMPNLRSLKLNSWHIGNKVVPMAASNPTFCALQELAFSMCIFDTLDTAAALLTITTTSQSLALKSITLWRVHVLARGHRDWLPPVALEPAARELRLEVFRRFKIEAPSMQKFFEWLVRPVTTLHLCIAHERDMDMASGMLRMAKDVLREVSLEFGPRFLFRPSWFQPSHPYPPISPGPSLSGFKALRRCSLTFILGGDVHFWGTDDTKAVYISALLGQLDSVDLKEIRLVIRYEHASKQGSVFFEFNAFKNLEWRHLEQSVNAGRLPSLERIVVQGEGDPLPFLSFMHDNHRMLRPLISLKL
jgi:hypothetical protein